MLCPLLTFHFTELLPYYNHQIYIAEDPKKKHIYIKALNDCIFHTKVKKAKFHNRGVVSGSVAFIKSQFEMEKQSQLQTPTKSDMKFVLAVENNAPKILQLILFCMFFPDKLIQEEAYHMSRQFLRNIGTNRNRFIDAEDRKLLEQELDKYFTAFKTRSKLSLIHHSKNISTILASGFVVMMEEAMQDYFEYINLIQDNPSFCLTFLESLIAWAKAFEFSSWKDEQLEHFYRISSIVSNSYGFNDDVKELWKNLVTVTADSKISQVDNTSSILQLLKHKIQDAANENIAREICICIYAEFPEEIISNLIFDLDDNNFLYLFEEQREEEDLSVVDLVIAETPKPKKENNKETSHVKSLEELYRQRNASIDLLMDLACEAQHVEHLFKEIPILVCFCIVHLNSPQYKSVQTLMLNLLLRMEIFNHTIGFESVEPQLSHGTLVLNWQTSSNAQHKFHDEVIEFCKNKPYEVMGHKLLPNLNSEIYASDFIADVMMTIENSLMADLLSNIADFALNNACTSTSSDMLLKYMSIFKSIVSHHDIVISQSKIYSLLDSILTSANLVDVIDNALSKSSIQLFVLSLKTLHLLLSKIKDRSQVPAAYWIAVVCLSNTNSEIYEAAIQIMLLFNDFPQVSNKSLQMDWNPSFAGVELYLLQGFNNPKLEVTMINMILDRWLHYEKNPSESTDKKILIGMILLLPSLLRKHPTNTSHNVTYYVTQMAKTLKSCYPEDDLHEAFSMDLLKKSSIEFLMKLCPSIYDVFLRENQTMVRICSKMFLNMLLHSHQHNQIPIILLLTHLLQLDHQGSMLSSFSPLVALSLDIVVSNTQSDISDYLYNFLSVLLKTIHDGESSSTKNHRDVVRITQKKMPKNRFTDEMVKELQQNIEHVINAFKHGNVQYVAKDDDDDIDEDDLDEISELSIAPVQKRTGFPIRPSPIPTIDEIKEKLVGSMKEIASPIKSDDEEELNNSFELRSNPSISEHAEKRYSFTKRLTPTYQNESFNYNRFPRRSTISMHLDSSLETTAANLNEYLAPTPKRSAPQPPIIESLEEPPKIVPSKKEEKNTRRKVPSSPFAIFDTIQANDNSVFEDELSLNQTNNSSINESQIEIEEDEEEDVVHETPQKSPPLPPLTTNLPTRRAPIIPSPELYTNPTHTKVKNKHADEMVRPSHPPPKKPPGGRASLPFRKVNMNDIINDPTCFGYFESFVHILGQHHKANYSAVIDLYNDIQDFIAEPKNNASAMMAKCIINHYLIEEAPSALSIPSDYCQDVINNYHKNPELPSKMLFSQLIDYCVTQFETQYLPFFLKSQQYREMMAYIQS